MKPFSLILILLALMANSCKEVNTPETKKEKEADPNNLAPTASTTAQMALGDALAVTLLAKRGFTASDFARFHPGGTLGKQLYLRVSDLYPLHAKPWYRQPHHRF